MSNLPSELYPKLHRFPSSLSTPAKFSPAITFGATIESSSITFTNILYTLWFSPDVACILVVPTLFAVIIPWLFTSAILLFLLSYVRFSLRFWSKCIRLNSYIMLSSIFLV